MRILHYFLGFHRQGGMNRYAADLARTQVEMGHEVFCLFPGGELFPRRQAVIRRRKPQYGVGCFELLGGPPVPLLEGVRDPEMILTHPAIPAEELSGFLDTVRPDILHIHCWMGMPPTLLHATKLRGARIVFTTHDYYIFCPRVNLIDDEGELCAGPENEHCSRCNRNAPSSRYLALRNCSILLAAKTVLAPLRRLLPHRKCTDMRVQQLPFDRLISYHQALLRCCDVVLFNSGITQRIYRGFLPELSGKVLPITHRGIIHRRREKKMNPQRIQLGFCGSSAPFKGLPMLLKVLKRLLSEGVANWSLEVWGTNRVFEDTEKIHCHGRYGSGEEEKVFAEMDLLLFPSVCWETFGLVAAEALSCGVPVLCSDRVGAQLLVDPEMVYHGEEGLYRSLRKFLMSPERLSEQARRICTMAPLPVMREHAKEVVAFYCEKNGDEN